MPGPAQDPMTMQMLEALALWWAAPDIQARRRSLGEAGFSRKHWGRSGSTADAPRWLSRQGASPDATDGGAERAAVAGCRAGRRHRCRPMPAPRGGAPDPMMGGGGGGAPPMDPALMALVMEVLGGGSVVRRPCRRCRPRVAGCPRVPRCLLVPRVLRCPRLPRWARWRHRWRRVRRGHRRSP